MAGSHSDSRLCLGGTWHQLERRFWRHWSRKPLWGLDDEQARHKVLGVCAKTQPRAQGKGRDIHVRRQGLPGGWAPCPPWLPQLGDPGSCRHPSWTRVGDAEISPRPHGCCWDTSIRFTLFRWEVILQRTCASFCWDSGNKDIAASASLLG